MSQKGFATQVVLIIIGAVLIGGAFVYMFVIKEPAEAPGSSATTTPSESEEPGLTGEQAPVPSKPSTSSGSGKPATPATGSGSTGTAPAPTPTPTTPPSTSTPTTPVPTEPTPTPAPTPAPVVYDPGFQASTRVTPEIPSENERATLPACDTKLFTLEPVDMSAVASISATGRMSASGPNDYAVFTFAGSGEFYKYDVYAPGDVWITHIAQETGITADPEDTTIYFALCRDVFGYVTHVKEMSAGIYEMVTDSYCLGKPHTGANACHIKILEQVGRGSALGKVGRLEGSFGFGIIDLRKERGLSNPYGYPIKTNFAACPFAFFTSPQGFWNKLASGTDLCTAP